LGCSLAVLGTYEDVRNYTRIARSGALVSCSAALLVTCLKNTADATYRSKARIVSDLSPNHIDSDSSKPPSRHPPLSLEDAQRLVHGYVEHYNNVRLNSAIGYITPKDMLAGHQREIQAERDRKLEAARKQRQIRRQRAA
jgi:hypothetical protein